MGADIEATGVHDQRAAAGRDRRPDPRTSARPRRAAGRGPRPRPPSGSRGRGASRPPAGWSRPRTGGWRGRRTPRRATASTSRSTTSWPSRSPTSCATETSSSPSGARPPRGAPGRGPRRRARRPRRPASRSSGTPSRVRGSGRSAPRVQIWVEPDDGWTRSRPSSPARPTASGRRASIDSAPTSTCDAADDAGAELAAHVGRAFEQEDGEPGTAEFAGRGQAGDDRRRPRRHREPAVTLATLPPDP